VCDTPAGTLWNLQASEKLNPCEWQTIQTFTNTAGQTVTLQDAISRSPGTNRARFYRLVPF
jgi:hypothetical protein